MPHIHGERIVLREYRMSDFQSMREWVNDPEITQYLSDIFLMIYLMMITMLDYRMLEEGEREWKQNESRLSEPQTTYRMGWS